MIEILLWILEAVLRLVAAIPGMIVAWARRHPLEAFLVSVAIIRLFGTTVRSGQVGVLFRFGRVVRVVEPGFTWLLPGLETVRKMYSRAITLDLAPQRIATADGLVYDVSANLVYRAADPVAAMVNVDDLTSGCETAVALAAYEVLKDARRADLLDRDRLDEALTSRARERLGVWGVTVDRAAFTNIAATDRTLRVTQIGLLARERSRMLSLLEGGGLSRAPAMMLLGSSRTLVSHARARYREAARRKGPAGALMIERVRIKLTPDERDAADALMAIVLEEGWASGEAEEKVVAMGRRAIPYLRVRSRRVGSDDARATIQRMIERIEKAEKKKKEKEADKEQPVVEEEQESK